MTTEKYTTLTHVAQIPAWIGVFTQELAIALREPLHEQSQRLTELETQVRQLNQNLEGLLDVQLTQIEAFQDALKKRRNK